MSKKYIIRTLLVIIAVTGTFLAFSALSNTAVVAPDSSCKESLNNCPKQEKGGKMVWENLPNQFFSSI
ncbi:MAG: hypothetical protein ABIR18_04140 [Chitinophagaceae bacterium]